MVILLLQTWKATLGPKLLEKGAIDKSHTKKYCNILGLFQADLEKVYYDIPKLFLILAVNSLKNVSLHFFGTFRWLF